MTRTVEYHCLHCLEHSITRQFNVPHVSLSCDSCGEFGRFIQDPPKA